MQIQFKKDQLGFLDTYVKCIDSSSPIHEKFKISGKAGDSKIVFSQLSNLGYLITEIDYQDVKDFEFIFDTSTFVSLIKLLDKEVNIIITSSGIEFNGNKYDICNEEIEIGDVYELLNKINNSDKSFKLIEIDKFNNLKDYVGQQGLDTVSYQLSSSHDRYFVSSNKLYVTAFCKTEFKNDNDFYFSSGLFQLLNDAKIKEIDIKLCDNFYFCKVDKNYILILNKEEDYYILPNMFKEDIRRIYEHPFHIQVEKSKIIEALERMRIIAKNNRENRIFVSIKSDSIELINNDNQYAIEKIKTVSSNNTEMEFPLSVNYFLSIIYNLTGKTIDLYYNTQIDDLICIDLSDEIKDRFYLLNLLEG